MNQFDQLHNRKGTNSVKWDNMKGIYGEDNLLPMWVADMDFRPPEAVMNALQARLDHQIFGYTTMPTSTYNAIGQWVQKRHQWKIDSSWLLFSAGVVPALGLAILAFTEPGDQVLLQSPVYTPFFTMIESNNRKVANCPLQLENNRYEIDFIQLEKKLQENVKLFFLCNPHNPSGRVWSREELTKIAELCKKYKVILVSDEIHSDLVRKPLRHIPIASIDPSYQDFIITCIAPSKTFNLAGLQSSCMIIPNQELREKVEKIQHMQGFHSLNIFAITAMEAAYLNGEKWLDELLSYLDQNIQLVKETLQKELPSVKVMEPDGGYLIWIDCRGTGFSSDELVHRFIQKGNIALEPGAKYGDGGDGFFRMNIGCPRELVEEGLERFIKAIKH